MVKHGRSRFLDRKKKTYQVTNNPVNRDQACDGKNQYQKERDFICQRRNPKIVISYEEGNCEWNPDTDQIER